jgi:hypothetical protein
MEYAAYQDGYGYLSKGQTQRAQGSEKQNEWRITASRDKGLRPLLARIESLINEEILASWNPKYANKYKFCFVGLDAENREEEIGRLQAEVQLHTTLDEAREQAELEPMGLGGGLILNPLLVSTLQSNLFKGVFMEKFMGIDGAADRPDLQYIPDPMWFQWQDFSMNMLQQQSMQAAGVDPDQDPNKPPPGAEAKNPPPSKDASPEQKAKYQAQHSGTTTSNGRGPDAGS